MRNLRLAAKEALRGKRTRPAGATFFMEMEKELPALHEELRDGTYAHGGYHYFWIHDPKDRLVAAAPFRDRVVHHAIVRVIEPIFEGRFIEDSFACRRGTMCDAGTLQGHGAGTLQGLFPRCPCIESRSPPDRPAWAGCRWATERCENEP